MRYLDENDLEALKIGCAVLGSGGGGDPTYSHLAALHLLKENGPIILLDPQDLKDEDFIMPVGFLGSPTVKSERLINAALFEGVYKSVCAKAGRSPTAVMAGEIGGGNAFTPIIMAAKYGLALVDGDLIGRAFPCLHMNVCELHGIEPGLCCLGDCLGKTVWIESKGAKDLEAKARNLCQQRGSSALIALYMMSADKAKRIVHRGSVSYAIEIGKLLQTFRDPKCLNTLNGVEVIAKGVVADTLHKVHSGFLYGSAKIAADSGRTFSLHFQNEYLLLESGGKRVIETPDLIVLFDPISAFPIASEKLEYGSEVVIVRFCAPAIWNTEKGLEYVGPKEFGYE